MRLLTYAHLNPRRNVVTAERRISMRNRFGSSFHFAPIVALFPESRADIIFDIGVEVIVVVLIFAFEFYLLW